MKTIEKKIKKAKKYLDKNHCIAGASETVYGLAGNAYSDQACKKIFSLKNSIKSSYMYNFHVADSMEIVILDNLFLNYVLIKFYNI